MALKSQSFPTISSLYIHHHYSTSMNVCVWQSANSASVAIQPELYTHIHDTAFNIHHA